MTTNTLDPGNRNQTESGKLQSVEDFQGYFNVLFNDYLTTQTKDTSMEEKQKELARIQGEIHTLAQDAAKVLSADELKAIQTQGVQQLEQLSGNGAATRDQVRDRIANTMGTLETAGSRMQPVVNTGIKFTAGAVGSLSQLFASSMKEAVKGVWRGVVGTNKPEEEKNAPNN